MGKTYVERSASIALRKLKEKKFNYKTIECLKNQHYGQDIYVLGSGSSLNHINPSFFNNKIVIGTNRIYRHFHTDFLVVIHNPVAKVAIDYPVTLVMSKQDCGIGNKLNLFHTDKPYYIFNHLNNQGAALSPLDIDTTDTLAVGASTMSSAIHFAYFLGAQNIILCGHDSGLLDGDKNIIDYYTDEEVIDINRRHRNNQAFFDMSEKQTLELVNKIREKEVNVFSLNPFINFNLEGHKYTRTREETK